MKKKPNSPTDGEQMVMTGSPAIPNSHTRKCGRPPVPNPCSEQYGTVLTKAHARLFNKKCAAYDISCGAALRSLAEEWLFSPRFTCDCGCRFQVFLDESDSVGELYATYRCPKCGAVVANDFVESIGNQP